MDRKRILVIGLVILMVTSACSLFTTVSNAVSGGQTVNQASGLWEDVPQIDGLVKANLELPLTARLLVQSALKAASDSGGTLNVVSFTTQHTPKELLDFYTTEKMGEAGWDVNNDTGCLGSPDDAASAGGSVCVFTKHANDETGSFLALVVIENSKDKVSQVFFARMDVTVTPTP